LPVSSAKPTEAKKKRQLNVDANFSFIVRSFLNRKLNLHSMPGAKKRCEREAYPSQRGNLTTFTARPVLRREFPMLAHSNHDTSDRGSKFSSAAFLLF
jgi:hypothetical protein